MIRKGPKFPKSLGGNWLLWSTAKNSCRWRLNRGNIHNPKGANDEAKKSAALYTKDRADGTVGTAERTERTGPSSCTDGGVGTDRKDGTIRKDGSSRTARADRTNEMDRVDRRDAASGANSCVSGKSCDLEKRYCTFEK